MSEGKLVYEKREAIAQISFDNPSAHNALTHQMWCDLRDVCREIAQDSSVRVVTFRGVGGKAFISGTDISGFVGFTSGRDGIAYERHIDECMAAVDALPVTTIAIIEGWAVGGGLNIFSAADIRIATPDARFASPLGRTIGNCLSMSSCARIAGAIGVTMAKRMLLLGEVVSAQEMMSKGVLYNLVEAGGLDAAVETLCLRAVSNAPLTTRASKEMIRRLSSANLPNIDDLIEQVYGSEDFKRGVQNFVAKNKGVPQWSGK
ncbi:enoyl-CoA hydratase [Steroidobacter cummioxidans]|uniref:enoyl-CoA hydratase n=1 Tax=Steroidobacter cummioxidans TaxID=1803913 RepID=UPI000E323723|nr:enoyl-CoA hydratase [Steroidobacter cummioxidans]